MGNGMASLAVCYTVRESARARRVSLRVVPARGLEIVVPAGRRRALDVARLLHRHRRWIRAALERAAARPPAPPWGVPGRIVLPAVGRAWSVSVREQPARGVTIRERPDGWLQVSGGVAREADCRRAFQRWLRRQAARHLPPLLQGISQELGRPYAGLGIRCQRARWGSCSRRGRISLNARLMLLAPELVRYVLVHELCHTRELNHQPRFWRLVAAACPAYRALDRALRNAWPALPAWA